MMKLLWYSDALSYKHRGYAISGLVYRSLPMGAVPAEYQSILDLDGLPCEEIEIGDGTGYKFLASNNEAYAYLSQDDMEIMDIVARRFAEASKGQTTIGLQTHRPL